MVSEGLYAPYYLPRASSVLILVLVEDGLGVAQTFYRTVLFNVLILVLVEDGLGEDIKETKAAVEDLS